MRRLQLIAQQKSGHHDHISSKLKIYIAVDVPGPT